MGTRNLVPAVLLTCLLAVAAPVNDPDTSKRDADAAKKIAAVVLDPAKSDPERTKALESEPKLTVAVLRELTRDIKPGDLEEEYRRIPWIWRAAIATGRRNDAAELYKLLELALPAEDQPLRDWQAVVVGGGVVGGISERDMYPVVRVTEILANDKALFKRWQRTVELSFPMADDEKVKSGTRYDALRLIAMADWAKAAPALRKYLAKDAHPELQQGAVSGLVDVPHAEAADMLIAAVPHLTEANRKLAIAGLLRDTSRATKLLDALDSGHIKPAELTPEQIQKLREHPDETVKKRAGELPAAE